MEAPPGLGCAPPPFASPGEAKPSREGERPLRPETEKRAPKSSCGRGGIPAGKPGLLPALALLAAALWAAAPARAASPPARNPCAVKNPPAANPSGGNPCAPSRSPRPEAAGGGNPCAPRNPRAGDAGAKAGTNPQGGRLFDPFADDARGAGGEKPPPPPPPPGGGVQWGESRAGVARPRYLFTQRPDASVRDAVARGRRAFRRAGCVGCHPRGRTIYGHAADVTGATHPFPIPTLIGAADHFPRLGPAGRALSVGQFNDFCATTFLGEPPMDPYSQKYKDLEAYVVSLSPERYERMLAWEAKRKALTRAMRGTPGAGGGASTPSSGGGEKPAAPTARIPGGGGGKPVGGNPCAPSNPRAGKPGAAPSAPAGGGNPCAPRNPCAAKNPCAIPNARAKNPCAKP